MIDQDLRIALYPPRAGLPGATVADVLASGGGGGGAVAIEDEGVPILAAAATLNFIGALVAVVDAGADQANITIDGVLNNLTDVNAPSPTTDEGLFWSGLAWEANPAIVANPDGLVTLFHDINSGANFSISADSLGANLRDHVGTTPNDLMLRWIEGTFVVILQARIGFEASDSLLIENSIVSGSNNEVIVSALNGSVILREAGNDALETIGNGINVLPGGGADNAVRVDITNAAGVARAQIGYSANDDLTVQNRLTSGEVQLRSEGSDDVLRSHILVGGAFTASALAFYGTAPIVLQTGVAVTDVAIHAALVNLGLITA